MLVDDTICYYMSTPMTVQMKTQNDAAVNGSKWIIIFLNSVSREIFWMENRADAIIIYSSSNNYVLTNKFLCWLIFYFFHSEQVVINIMHSSVGLLNVLFSISPIIVDITISYTIMREYSRFSKLSFTCSRWY